MTAGPLPYIRRAQRRVAVVEGVVVGGRDPSDVEEVERVDGGAGQKYKTRPGLGVPGSEMQHSRLSRMAWRGGGFGEVIAEQGPRRVHGEVSGDAPAEHSVTCKSEPA